MPDRREPKVGKASEPEHRALVNAGSERQNRAGQAHITHLCSTHLHRVLPCQSASASHSWQTDPWCHTTRRGEHVQHTDVAAISCALNHLPLAAFSPINCNTQPNPKWAFACRTLQVHVCETDAALLFVSCSPRSTLVLMVAHVRIAAARYGPGVASMAAATL